MKIAIGVLMIFFALFFFLDQEVQAAAPDSLTIHATYSPTYGYGWSVAPDCTWRAIYANMICGCSYGYGNYDFKHGWKLKVPASGIMYFTWRQSCNNAKLIKVSAVRNCSEAGSLVLSITQVPLYCQFYGPWLEINLFSLGYLSGQEFVMAVEDGDDSHPISTIRAWPKPPVPIAITSLTWGQVKVLYR